MRNIYFKLTIAVAALLVQSVGAFPIITNIVEIGGDNEATDTVTTKWTGVTYVGGVANEPLPGLAAGAPYTVGAFGVFPTPAFVDRAHHWTNASDTVLIPEYFRGAEYIMNGNDNRDNATMTMEVFVTRPVRVYLLIDNRLSDTSDANPPTLDAGHMQWVLDEGWQPVKTGVNRTRDINLPDEIGIDESADGTINNHSSIYSKDFPTSTSILLKQADNAGQNMYGAVVVPLPGPLPYARNIGQNKVGTVADEGNGDYTIVGGGNDIWDQRDEFTYAYTEVTGDFDVQVRVQSLTASANWPKAGLMARETLSEYGRMAFARVTSDQPPGVNDVRFAYRTGLDNVNGANGGQHEDGGGNPSGIPNAWLRLARIGNTMFMSNSADGIAWNLVSSQDTTTWGGGALSNKLFVGLGVSRHPSATTPTVTAVFRNFQFNSNAAPFAVVGAESRGNPNGVRVLFNNPAGAGALTPGNYTLTTMGGPNVTTVTGVRFTTANDSPNRDPLTYTLEGTTADPSVGAWELIASGDTGLATDPGRNTVGPAVNFANAREYRAYRVLFPTVRDAATANSMQIADIELLDAGGADVTAPGDAVLGVRAVAGQSVSAIAVAGTAGGVNNYPAGENPANAIDNGAGTKYLNFAKTNTGIIVTPTGGVQPGNPVVTAAAYGPNVNTVQLTVSQLVEGAGYELLVDANVKSSDGQDLSSAVALFTHGAGYEARRIHVTHNKTDDGGYYRVSDATANAIGDVSALAGGVIPPLEPNTVFEDPTPDTGSNERFSSSMYGVLSPTVTGNHIFYMSSDDPGRLYLSTDANPANKVQIASEPSWNGRREYIAGGNQATRGTPPTNISLPISLQAAGRYYMELSFTEGGGGNNGSATWLPPGGATVANGTSPILEQFFVPSRLRDGNSYNTLGPVRIISQPATQTVLALLPVTFTVGLDGTPSYTYQWRRNGTVIPGANSRSYTIPAAQLTDDQAVFSVDVANEFSRATSANATLTVQSPTPPHLTGAAADATFTTVTVSFDNRLEVASAQNTANYTISGGVIVNSATRDATGRRVVLGVSTLTSGTSYTLTVRDLHDETGTTTLIPNPSMTNFTGWVFSRGVAVMEVYPTGGGNAVSVLTTHPSYPNSPSERYSIAHIDSRDAYPNDSHEGYGGRISGLFVPLVTGDQIFYLRSDDASELWLSTDSDPANKVKIQEETGCCNAFAAHTSAPIPLVQGTRYYYEVLWKEGTGGDFAQVSIDGINVVPGQYLGGFANPDLVSLVITQQPQSITRTVNGFGVFTVGASLTSFDGNPRTLYYQWRLNGVDIPGANSASYVTPPLTLANEGEVYSAEVSTLGATVVSANATLHVVDDNVPPVLVKTATDASFKKVILTWSELMEPNAAEEEGSYVLNGPGITPPGISPASAVLVNGTNVVLTFGQALQDGATYQVDIGFQADLIGNQTVKVGNPVVDTAHGVVADVLTWVISPGFTRFDAYLGLPGGATVDTFVALPVYPDGPTFTFYTNQVNWPQSVPNIENYAMRFTGLFIAAETGTYQFDPAHDDPVRLRFSHSEDPADPAPDEYTAVCCTGLTGGPTLSVAMVAGQRYYYELIVVENGGGDYAGFSVITPSAVSYVPAPSQFLAVAVDPALSQNAGIEQQPQDQTVVEYRQATFSVVVTNTGSAGANYQWQFKASGGASFANIPGATARTYTTPALQTTANEGDQYRVIVYAFGRTLNSSAGTVHVTADTVKPVALSATSVCGNRSRLDVVFNELIGASGANAANYSLGTPSVSSAVVIGSRVVLTLSAPLDSANSYAVTITGVADLAGNVINPNPTVVTVGFSFGYVTNASGQIVVEAENYDENTPAGANTWALGTTPAGNGSISGAYMFSTPDLGGNFNPPLDGVAARLDYCVNLPTAGTWFVWARGCGIDGAANSVHVGVDGTPSNEGLQLGNFNALWDLNTWNWTSDTTVLPARFSVASAGIHTFNLWVREDGIRVDRFLLTADPAFSFAANRTVIGPEASTVQVTLPSAPRLSFNVSGGALNLSWSGAARLQCTASLTPPVVWQDINTGGATTYTVDPANQFDVNLDTAQAGGGARTGTGSGTVTVSGSIATVDVSYSGLSGDRTVDHFHAPAARGATAGVVYDLGGITTGLRSGTVKGNVTLADGAYGGKNVAAQVQDMRASLWYLNIHTTAFGGGEIRGQVEPAKARFYRLVSP